ncbi:alpha/beta hydrolase [Acidovorax sp. PRC11]|uniref:alpha/beta hydrolase n=1 Tax=Acidovorax sp. PRC11 TaxID=2962592 RepID=UPI0028827CB9|nr:alpha/beta hydrolase [Acidovorax sp. PRC11]MDT0137883.1 alpha/beta hydrolase [Acidovorax sp. PRC11]
MASFSPSFFRRFSPRAARTAAVLALAASLGACSGVGTLNALTPRSAATVDTGVAYGPLPRQRLDVYRPAAPAPVDGWPVVVFFYGGTWNSGERGDYLFLGQALASRGVLALVADYRLYPEVRYPDFVRDSALAVGYGLEQAARWGGDPRRVFVMGHSAGGYNAAMVALDPRWLAATGHAPRELAGWIGLAGPYDFFPTDNPDAQPVFFHPDYPAHAQPSDFMPPPAAGARPSSSALQMPRAFLAAPERDRLVSPERSTLQIAHRLQAAGVPVVLKTYPRASHTTLVGAFAWPLRWVAPVLDDVSGFVASAPPTAATPAGR